MNTPLQVITLEPPQPADAAVIWLHGLGADGHDFEPIVPELKLGGDHGVRFLFPHAPIRPITINGGMEMRGWYDIKGMGLDREVDELGIKESAAATQELLEAQLQDGISAKRIVLAGFSQGGAIALQLGLRYGSTLGGIMALSTYLPLAETLPSEASSAQQNIPIFVAHGTHDPMVPETHGATTCTVLREAGYAVEYKTYPMQHAVCAEEIHDIAAWLKRALPQL